MGDTEVDNIRTRMAKAAELDTEARTVGQPAMHKLKMLPEVVALLHRNQYQNQLVDPDINLLESVRFFLEPLNDGSLPAYNIQRELFAALGKLPITKETLVASGIGKVVMFYTRSIRTEALIKRQAEKLLSDWMRPILNRTDDYRQKAIATADYDPTYGPPSSSPSIHSHFRLTHPPAVPLPAPPQNKPPEQEPKPRASAPSPFRTARTVPASKAVLACTRSRREITWLRSGRCRDSRDRRARRRLRSGSIGSRALRAGGGEREHRWSVKNATYPRYIGRTGLVLHECDS
jgi:TFIIS helical bundle-like domain